MSITTTTQIAAPVNVVFQMELLRNAQAVTPYFVGNDPATISEHSGTFTAKWRRIENLTPTTTALAELTGSLAFPTRTADQPSVTDITATVQKFGKFIFINEEVDLVNYNGQAEKLVKILGINAGRSLNRLQRNELEDNSTKVFGAGSTATAVTNSTITRSMIQQIVNTLNRNDAMRYTGQTTGSTNIGTQPIRSAYWGICHFDVEEDVRSLTGFVSVETYAGQTGTAKNEFGSVGGVRFISTSEATIDANSGATVTSTATGNGRTTAGTSYDLYNTVIFSQDYHGSVGLGFEHVKEIYQAGDNLPGVQMISKAKGTAGPADPLNEVASLGWKSWHAPVILNSGWGRVLIHTASKLTP